MQIDPRQNLNPHRQIQVVRAGGLRSCSRDFQSPGSKKAVETATTETKPAYAG